MSLLSVYLVFFLSGISGLLYQVVWVRAFGNVFGNTVYSATTVTAVFLCGLGVGGYVAGRWADRRFLSDAAAPLRAYGFFELGIAALALAVAAILPQLAPLSAMFSSYTTGPEGYGEPTFLSHAGRYVIAVALLAPVTFLMGGTLTLLIRYLVARDLGLAAWRIGALYGINTLGAAVGAFASDFALIPRIGILRTELIAVGLNLLAGAGALLAARRMHGRPTDAPAAAVPTDAASGGSPRLLTYTASALFLSGLAAMGMEIVWFRFLVSVMGATRSVFSLLLTVILLGVFAGSLLGGWLHRRAGRPAEQLMRVQTLLVLTVLGTLAFFDVHIDLRLLGWIAGPYVDAPPVGRLALEGLYNLAPALALVGLPALLMGTGFPLANAHVQRLEEAVGRRAGALYLANTFGNVAGSLLAGFVLLPFLGMQMGTLVLAGCGALSLVPLYLTVRPAEEGSEHVPLRTMVAYGVALALALGAWSVLPARHLLRSALPPAMPPWDDARVVTVSEGINENIAVIDKPGFSRHLFTNGHAMSGTSLPAQRYMRLFSHLPLMLIDEPKRVLVICVGVGNTLSAAAIHPSVEQIDAVDLSKHVIEHLPFFGAFNRDVFEDERLAIFVNDGRQHLRMQPPGTYDLVTLEPPPISQAGVSSLYSREFYELGRSRLVPGGFVTQWLPAYQLPGDEVLALIRAFVDVFPASALLSGDQRELILIGVNDDSLRFDLDRVRRKIADNEALAADLRRIQLESLTEIVGTFAASGETLARATRDVAALTDDRPTIEYSVRSSLYESILPTSMFDVSAAEAWCPDCFENGEPVPEVFDLEHYLTALQACYENERFLRYSPLVAEAEGTDGPRAAALRDPRVRAAVERSPYLSRVFQPAAPGRGQAPPCAVGPAGGTGRPRPDRR